MRSLESNPCRAFMTRRTSLQVGVLGRLLLSPRLPASSGTSGRKCILVWLDGGPSHLETFDLKPNAPLEVRGPFEPIATKIPGLWISECLPRMAAQMNDWLLIRSLTSPLGEHNLGTHYLLSGYMPNAAIQYPSLFSAAGTLNSSHSVLPAHVAVPDYDVGGQGFSGHGYLPVHAAPFSLRSDPSRPEYRGLSELNQSGLDASQLERRRDFASRVKALRLTENLPLTQSADQQERAFELLTSSKAHDAFDISQESPETRSEFGATRVGQCCLLAARLIRHEVPYVTVNFKGWDTHASLQTALKDGFTGAKTPVGLIPQLDTALSGLIEYLRRADLLNSTLVVVMGEFGRTPRINAQGGRDHWPRVFSAAVAGGGVAGGRVLGESDRHGEVPHSNPVTPSDFLMSVCLQLGIDPATQLTTSDGRPIRLCPDSASPVPGW